MIDHWSYNSHSVHDYCTYFIIVCVFFRKTGLIGFDYFGKEGLDSFIDAMKTINVPYELWTGEQANRMYPRQLNVNPTSKCIFEEDGGVLKASVGLRVLQVWNLLIDQLINI